jgi:hypothetical protein
LAVTYSKSNMIEFLLANGANRCITNKVRFFKIEFLSIFVKFFFSKLSVVRFFELSMYIKITQLYIVCMLLQNGVSPYKSATETTKKKRLTHATILSLLPNSGQQAEEAE